MNKKGLGLAMLIIIFMNSELSQAASLREGENNRLSPLKDTYKLLNVHSPLEMHQKYSKEDQRLMKNQGWDYDNPDLIINKVKDLLDKLNPADLTEEENVWRSQIIYWWYHHAISCAVFLKKDKEAALKYSELAMKNYPEGNSNKITKLFYLLIRDEVEDAKKWMKEIDEDEQDAAEWLMSEYKKGFFG